MSILLLLLLLLALLLHTPKMPRTAVALYIYSIFITDDE